MEKVNVRFTVSDFIAVTNQALEHVYPSVEIEGEVASFKVNQNKYVFFDLKDEGGSVGCFMTVWQLRQPIEDGMKVVVSASPKLTQWGKFSLTIKSIRPVGEGSLKKSFEILKAKLDREGIFAPERKRPLPEFPGLVGVISSTQAAGYADFMKIAGDRWGGVKFEVAHVQVQGESAPDQMIRALKYFNSHETLPDVIVMIRGGGSADDLAAFNDELLVREVAASRVPVLTGIGHEIDESLVDLAADVQAATPSNAAQILLPDKNEIRRTARYMISSILPKVERSIDEQSRQVREQLTARLRTLEWVLGQTEDRLTTSRRVLAQLDPELALRRGYSILRGNKTAGAEIEIETLEEIIKAEVKDVKAK